jgi:UDP-glucose:(heptosyl)LPS alpha-1,3-glucosyltransferase
MKILFCAKHVVGNGGQEGFLRRLCAFLLSQGHEVEIIASAADPVQGATCTRVPVPRWVGRAAWDWAAARAVVSESTQHERDVSFGGQKMWGCNVIRPGGGVEAEYWNVRLSDRHAWPPLRALAREMSIKRRFDLYAESRAYNDPALRFVVANSELVRNGILQRYPRLTSNVNVIYNGADLKRFSATPDADTRTRIHNEVGLDPARHTAVFAGHNFRLKGLPQALAAMELAGRDNREPWQLLVIGGGRRASMQNMVQRLGLTNSVRFVGNTSTPEQYYASSDVLLFPSFYDPCANVTFEALASGIPVISTKRNGASEVITDARDGWTVDHPNCIETMAAHLNALEDPGRLSEMKAAARALAEKHSITKKLTEIEEVLKEASRLG